MKADPAVQRRLLDLADVDAELARLAHRRRTLPEHAQLTDAETAVRTAKDKLVAVETAAGDLDRDIRRLERDVEGVRARARARQHAAGGLGRRRPAGHRAAARAGDPRPPPGRAGGRAAGGHGAARGRRRATSSTPAGCSPRPRRPSARSWSGATRRSPTSTPPRPGAAATASEIAVDLPADLLVLYDKRREQRGTGAAALLQRRCQACRLELDRTAIGGAAGRAARRGRVLRGVRSDPGADAGVGPVKRNPPVRRLRLAAWTGQYRGAHPAAAAAPRPDRAVDRAPLLRPRRPRADRRSGRRRRPGRGRAPRGARRSRPC